MLDCQLEDGERAEDDEQCEKCPQLGIGESCGGRLRSLGDLSMDSLVERNTSIDARRQEMRRIIIAFEWTKWPKVLNYRSLTSSRTTLKYDLRQV
jgi:hypothetical protein